MRLDAGARLSPGGWAMALVALLAVCLCGGALGLALLRQPRLTLATDSIWVCGGVNVRGQFRIGFGWASNLVGMVPVQTVLSHTLCGYFPRLSFLPAYGIQVFAW